MIEASCHCGAVRFAVEAAPDDVNDCNCSICRRYGTLWGYYQRPQVRFAAENEPTDIYIGATRTWSSTAAALAAASPTGRRWTRPMSAWASMPGCCRWRC